MGRADRIVFVVLACAAWAYVLARAVMVPVTHDEAGAFHMFILTGDFVPFAAGWDAGNHFVYDALAQVSWFLSGKNLFGLRVWCVLSFVLYAWYLWRSGAWFHSFFVRWCAWACLLWAPFMVEFFSLARGYGLGLAFWAMALYHLVAWSTSRAHRDLVALLAGMALAGWSTLSMLMVWGGVLAFVVGRVLVDRSAGKKAFTLGITALLGALPWAMAVLFAFGLKQHGGLNAGTDKGYMQGTIGSVLGHVSGCWGFPALMALLVVAVAIAGLLKLDREGHVRSLRGVALSTLLGLLVFDGSAQSLTSVLLGTHLPTDRAALYLVQPAVLVLALGIDAIGERANRAQVLAAGLLLLPLREFRRLNLDHTTHWIDQAIPEEFYRIVADRQRSSDRWLLVGAQLYQSKSTWDFGMWQHGVRLNELDALDFPQPLNDLLILDPTKDTAPPGFRPIAKGPSGRIELLERVTPLRTGVLVDTAMAFPLSGDEFRMLWTREARPYAGKDLVLECEMWINSPRRLTNSMIFAFVEETDGQRPFDHHVRIDNQRGAVKEGPFHLALRLPRIGVRAERIQFGLYDPERCPFAMDSVRVRIQEISP